MSVVNVKALCQSAPGHSGPVPDDRARAICATSAAYNLSLAGLRIVRVVGGVSTTFDGAWVHCLDLEVERGYAHVEPARRIQEEWPTAWYALGPAEFHAWASDSGLPTA